MKVLTIISYDDSNTGDVTAVLLLPEGVNEDALFVKWLKKNSSYWSKKTDEQCMEAEYAWNVKTVEEI